MTSSARVGSFVQTPQTHRELAALESIAEWLDRRYLDPILGLVLPGVGDVVGSMVGLYGVGVALRLGVHPIVVARMLLNLALDSFIGSIPVLGAIGDFFFRAHVKNLELLQARGERGRATAGDWWIVLGAFFLFLLALALPVLLLIALVTYLIAHYS